MWSLQISREAGKDVFHIYLLINTHTHTHRIKIKVCMCVPEGNQLRSIVFFTQNKKPGREHPRDTGLDVRSRAQAGEGAF